MDPIVLLTILALVVAVYAIISPKRLLDLRLRLNWLDWTIVSIAVLAVLFFSVFKSLDRVPEIGRWRWPFDPSNTSYLTILCTTVIVFLHSRAPLRRRKVNLFHRLSMQLLQEGRYSDLLFLLQPRHIRLFRIYNTNLFFPRLRKKLTPRPEINIDKFLRKVETLKSGRTLSSPIKKRLLSFRSSLASILPSGDKDASTAEDIVRRVFLAEELVAYISEKRPYFALEVLSHEFFEREDFLELYIRHLLTSRSSILYFEIRNNQNVSSFHRYDIDERNRFIAFFLKDARVAERLAIYKPFGDFAVDYLATLGTDPANDTYSGPLGNYHEEDRWRCPIHTTIRFFDLMIPEALFQGIQWHMWLYYFSEFGDRIISNLAPKPNVDFTIEWPTPYHCLVYEIVSALRHWIMAVKGVDANQPNVVLKSEQLNHENGNIPKSAILALGQVMRSVMESDSLDTKFKAYLLDIALRALRDLAVDAKTKPLSVVLQKSILQGGYGYRSNSGFYLRELRAAFMRLDSFLRHELKDFEQELGEQ